MKVKTKKKNELELKITLNEKDIKEFERNLFWVDAIDVTVTNTDGCRRVNTGILTRLVKNIADSVYHSTATEKQ